MSTPHVRFTVVDNDDAQRVANVLEALGYKPERVFVEESTSVRLTWLVNYLTRRHKLTEREVQVITLVLEGVGPDQIAEQLSVTRATVKWHMHNLLCKTDTINRETLVRYALRALLCGLDLSRGCLVDTFAPEVPS